MEFYFTFVEIDAPLHSLTRAGSWFLWTKEQERAFNILKEKICEALETELPNLQKPFEIVVDVFSYAIHG